MKKPQREIINPQQKFQSNAINDIKHISLSHVIKLGSTIKRLFDHYDNIIKTFTYILGQYVPTIID